MTTHRDRGRLSGILFFFFLWFLLSECQTMASGLKYVASQTPRRSNIWSIDIESISLILPDGKQFSARLNHHI